MESDSVQPAPRLRRELLHMVGLAADRLRGLGARVASVDAGFQQVLVPPPPRLRQAPLPGPERGFPGLLSPPPAPSSPLAVKLWHWLPVLPDQGGDGAGDGGA